MAGLSGVEPKSVVGVGAVLDLTLSLDTSQYADNDVLAAPQEIQDAFRADSACMVLESITLLDESDQGQDVELVFMDADGSLGNENAAVGPSDTVARSILGTVVILTTDYSDLANSMLATKRDVNLRLKALDGSRSLWVGAIVRSGTPTYAASGIRLKLGVRYE